MVCHGKNGPPKIGSPLELIFSINKEPPGTYFTAKYGLPLKNVDHLPQIDPEHISLAKFGLVAYLGGFRGFWKPLRPISSAACDACNVL